MPGYTSKRIPFPFATEPPNGSAQMEALATRVDELLTAADAAINAAVQRAETATAAAIASANAHSDAADVATRGGGVWSTNAALTAANARTKWGIDSVTTDANGEGTLGYNASFVPTVVMVTAEITGSDPITLCVKTGAGDPILQTGCKIRASRAGLPVKSATFRVHYIVRD